MISDFNEIKKLSGLPIESLRFELNPVCKSHNYWVLTIAYLKNLKILDNTWITLDERKDAERIAVKIAKFIEILKQNVAYLSFLG